MADRTHWYDKYKVNVPEAAFGDWKIEHIIVSDEDEKGGRMRACNPSSMGRFVPAGRYTMLYHFGSMWMSDTPDEMRDHLSPIIEAGRKFFDLDRIPIKIHIGDGRVFLEKTAQTYDFIMVDVFHDNFFIPFHLATAEFFELVRARLAPGGAMVMNVFSPVVETELYQLIRNTVCAVFPSVYDFRVQDLGFLLYAFHQEPDLEGLAPEALPNEVTALASNILQNWQRSAFDPGLDISRDSRPTVELLSAKSIFLQRPGMVPLTFRSSSQR